MQIVYTDRHLKHQTDRLAVTHQAYEVSEVPARAEIIRAALEAARLGPIVPPTDHGLEPILAVHDPALIELLQTAYERVSAHYGEPTPAVPHTFATRLPAPHATRTVWGQLGYYALDVASPLMDGTWEAAYWSAQCALSAVDLLMSQMASGARAPQAGESSAVYALCRPPGHHAARDLYGGYCYLNNAAIAARYLQTSAIANGARTGVEPARVALLDFDYHHGNGTQAIFYDDPSVLFCSIHADPGDEYPYFWGYAEEHGRGAGEGFNYNFPLPLGTRDEVYLDNLMRAIQLVQDFGPQYLVVSAGFDIFTGDPVGGFNVTTDGIARIGEAIADLALPTVIIQEGGYLQASLGENAVAFLEAFSESQGSA